MTCRIQLTLAAIAGVLGIATGGHADLYRCKTATGGVIFTDNAASCPGADPHESSGEVQSIGAPTGASTRVPPSHVAKPGPSVESGQATLWRQRKQTLDEEAVLLKTKKDYLEEYVTHCNRGRNILSRDDAGLPYQVSCDNIRTEYEKVNHDLARVSEQLNGGLEEACRRAGCLPGWIR